MKKISVLLLSLSLFLPLVTKAQSQPQPTILVVRALAQDAKFIGSSMGGALIVVKDAETGEILAKGKTTGSTGDTGRLMQTPHERQMQLSTPGAARFETTLQLEEPVFVTVEATAPVAQAQSKATVSTQLWLIPGKNITGDGVLLEIPGFAVDVMTPQAHASASGDNIPIRANVVMMCGCPTTPGGLWNSNDYEIQAIISRDGNRVDIVPLNYAGQESTYEASFSPKEGGAYEITVYAYHPETGNTGVDKTTVVFSEQ